LLLNTASRHGDRVNIRFDQDPGQAGKESGRASGTRPQAEQLRAKKEGPWTRQTKAKP
jgi:hypothetical protein